MTATSGGRPNQPAAPEAPLRTFHAWKRRDLSNWPWPGASESTDAWRVPPDLTGRALCAPQLVVFRRRQGLCAAIQCSLPNRLHQGCLVHVCRNLVAMWTPAQIQQW